MKVTRGKSDDDWKQARAVLCASRAAPEWSEAHVWIRERLKSRFLVPVERILTGDGYEGEGFAVAAIDCLLIEFLEALHRGSIYRRRKPQLSVVEHSSSEEMFVGFLSGPEPYKTHFDEAKAKSFYEGVRCGVLHEAATKGGWLIRADGELVGDRNGAPTLNRVMLHDALARTVEAYCEGLATSPALQDGFLRVMDNICGVSRAAYFAYGSNLDVDRLRKRISTPIHSSTRARLSGRRLAWNKPGADGTSKANLVTDASHHVWGVIYELDATAIDEIVKHKTDYERLSVVVDVNGKQLSATVFGG